MKWFRKHFVRRNFTAAKSKIIREFVLSFEQPSMAKKARQGGSNWSMKSDRELIVLSKTKTIAALADHFQRPPKSILDKAKRLGLSIKRSTKL